MANPEAKARLIIDTLLKEAGWEMQDARHANLGAKGWLYESSR